MAAFAELLHRVSAMVEDIPEITELDLNPVFVRRHGAVVADIRVRLTGGGTSHMTGRAEDGRSYALLADGTTLTIRPAGPGDYEAVRRLHEAMSPENLYFRFLQREPGIGRAGGPAGVPGRPARAWWRCSACWATSWWEWPVTSSLGDGAARRSRWRSPTACTGAVSPRCCLSTWSRWPGPTACTAFTAEVLADNYAVLHVLERLGAGDAAQVGHGVVELSMPIPRIAALGEASAYLDAVAGRDRHADVASLEPLLTPRSVAVVGAGRRPGSIGRTILLNIRDAGFAGTLYAVSPDGGDIEGIPCVPSVAALPEAPDLAVVTVPAARVVEVARECGKRGVKSLAVITAGLTTAQESGLMEAARRGGMRLAGPASYGIAVPGIGLAATPAVRHPPQGRTGLIVQSGGVGAALLEQFSRMGMGISSLRRGRRQARCLKYRHAAVVGG